LQNNKGSRKITFILKMIILSLSGLLCLGVVGYCLHKGLKAKSYEVSQNSELESQFIDSIERYKETNYANSTDDETDSFKVESTDADEFYEQNSHIISTVDVNNSDVVQTETELCENLAVRGFEDYPVTTEYSMNGEYFDATTISEASSEKHPIYQTYYVTANGEVWTIFIINGSVMANPVSYNMQSGLGVQVIISESETVTSYDCTTNKFYETIPDKSELFVKVVEEINAETLESLTFEVIDDL